MNQSFSILDKALAWSVHIFTASGLLAGFMSILAINAKNWRAAMAWLLLALLIDGLDGTFARKFKVKKVLPNIDGNTVDNVIDFATFAIIPAYFFYMAELVDPVWNLPLAFLILLVSAIYYGKTGMISDDYYFIGFPVMWNVVVFYLVFVFASGELVNTSIIIVFAVLHFVPIKFAYPSRATRLKAVTVMATVTILLIMPTVVWFYPEVPVWLKWAAIINLLYFGVLALVDTFVIEHL
jgi:phosphatidylcholine synthase